MGTDIHILPDEFVFRIKENGALYWCQRKSENMYDLDFWPRRDGFSPVDFPVSDLKKLIFEDKLWVIIAECIPEIVEDAELNALNII